MTSHAVTDRYWSGATCSWIGLLSPWNIGASQPVTSQGCVWLIALPHDDSHREADNGRGRQQPTTTQQGKGIYEGFVVLWKEGKERRGKERKGSSRPQGRTQSSTCCCAFSKRLLKLRSHLVNLNSHVGPEPTERFEVECLCEEVGNIEMCCNVGHS